MSPNKNTPSPQRHSNTLPTNRRRNKHQNGPQPGAPHKRIGEPPTSDKEKSNVLGAENGSMDDPKNKNVVLFEVNEEKVLVLESSAKVDPLYSAEHEINDNR